MQFNKSVPHKPYFSDLNQTLMGILWVCKRILDVSKNVVSSYIKVREKKGCILNHEVILVQAKLLFSLSISTEI